MAVVDLLLFFFFFFFFFGHHHLQQSNTPGQICDAGARSGDRDSNWRRQPVGGAGRDGGPHPAQLEGKTRSALGKECVESLMEGWPRPASLRGSSRWRIPPLPDDAGAKQPANLKQARSSATTTRRRTRGGRSTRCGRLGPGDGVETTIESVRRSVTGRMPLATLRRPFRTASGDRTGPDLPPPSTCAPPSVSRRTATGGRQGRVVVRSATQANPRPAGMAGPGIRRWHGAPVGEVLGAGPAHLLRRGRRGYTPLPVRFSLDHRCSPRR